MLEMTAERGLSIPFSDNCFLGNISNSNFFQLFDHFFVVALNKLILGKMLNTRAHYKIVY